MKLCRTSADRLTSTFYIRVVVSEGRQKYRVAAPASVAESISIVLTAVFNYTSKQGFGLIMFKPN